MQASVTLFFVDIVGFQVDPFYYACQDSKASGPFMSGGSAIEWRDEYAQGARVYSKPSTDAGVCPGPPLYKGADGWHRG